jgi:ribosomal protein S18 acetylase RimI-like enzyme
VAAPDLSVADLAAVWRQAYDGYFVPLQFDATQMARHIRWSGLDLSLSVVAFEGKAPIGLSLAARERDRAWIGGFGIAPAFRRQGWATRLMQAHAERLDTAGISETRLEVIDINPAIEVYRRSSFRIARELQVWEGELAEVGAAGVTLSRDALARAHARLHRAEPSWRRGLERLFNILDDGEAQVIGVERAGQVTAFAVILDQPERFGLFDAACENEAAGEALLAALAAIRAGARVRVVDEADGTPLARALETARFERTIRQFEMVRPRGRIEEIRLGGPGPRP